LKDTLVDTSGRHLGEHLWRTPLESNLEDTLEDTMEVLQRTRHENTLEDTPEGPVETPGKHLGGHPGGQICGHSKGQHEGHPGGYPGYPLEVTLADTPRTPLKDNLKDIPENTSFLHLVMVESIRSLFMCCYFLINPDQSTIGTVTNAKVNRYYAYLKK
jgi:hypothetical protein